MTMEGINCKNCESLLHGKFCSSCGQKVYSEKDKSISDLFHEVFHFITHFEGKLLHTLKTIYQNPGKLSLDYGNGIRQKYYKPISFYLLIVIIYLLFPLFPGMNMEMKFYKENLIFGEHSSHLIQEKLKKDSITEERLSEVFHEKSKGISKFSLLLLIPLSVPILYLLYFNKKRYLFDNFILVTEINIFFLLSLFILMPILFLPIMNILKINISDDFFTPFSFTLFWLYCILVFHKVFKEKWLFSILKGGIFCLLFIITLVVYKAIVFEITFALI